MYGQIQDVYVYNDHKVFQLQGLKVLQYCEHLRVIEVAFTSQLFLCTYNDLYSHQILHLKEKQSTYYIIDKECWFHTDNQ